MPVLHLLAGPNGSGKSTYVSRILQPVTHLPFVNADERARLLANGKSFITETVFSHPSKLDLVEEAITRGYLVHLHVMLVPVEVTVNRVAERVRDGGRDAPEQKIRERFARLWDLVLRVSGEHPRNGDRMPRGPFTRANEARAENLRRTLYAEGMSSKVRPSSSPALHYFGDSRCRSIWQWQLIIAFTVVAMALGVALLTPMRFSDGRFSIGVFAIIAITIVSLAVPWHRVGPNGVLVLPLLNSFAISVIALGNTAAATFLWVFPIAWVASYYSIGTLIATISLISLLRLINLFLNGLTVETMINMVILLITLGFVGVVMSVGAERNRSSRRLLGRQSDRLAHALHRMNEQKARNRRLLDSLDIGIARVGVGGLLEVSNEAFHTIFELEAAGHFYPAPAVEYRTRRGEPVPASQTAIVRASRGELFADQVVWLFGRDGQWRAVKTSTKRIEHGMVTGDGLLLLVEDITESIDPHAGAEATRRNISHELRNPLTAILGHIDLLLERTDLDDSAREQLDVVEHAGSRMQHLINQALTAPDKRAEEEGVDFDLADIVRASLEAFAPAADAGGVTVEADLDVKLCLHGDAFRIRQVVDNVLGNAIKYAQRGGRVTLHGLRPDSGDVVLRIADTGIGIGKEDLPRIFEREFRTQVARDSGIPGTGLGLNISHGIVIAQGGRIEVNSELGQGTEVTVVLPVRHELTCEGLSA